MSGITGIFYKDSRPVQSDDVASMIHEIRHRGIDGQDVWCHGNVGLGNVLLETTPESCFEELPYTDQKYKLTIAADARIDNRDELFDKLSLTIDNRKPDSFLILEAYKAWGEECAQYLLGDFTFVIWDHENQEMVCCRDYLGHRPFFYYNDEKSFVFASEIKGLRALAEIPFSINDVRVADYLQLIISNTEYTFYQDIYRLEPATVMTVTDGNIKSKKYFSFESIRPRKASKNDQCVDELKEKLFEAVRCRLRSKTEIGSQFSGGLDSSVVSSISDRILSKDERLHTYTATYQSIDPEHLLKIDEREFQNSVINSGEFHQRLFDASMMSPLVEADMYLDMMDEPVFFPHLHMNHECYRLTNEDGIRVLLNGTDGDSVISYGYEYLQQLFLRGKFFELFSQITQLSEKRQLGKWLIFRNLIVRPLFNYFRSKVRSIFPGNLNVNKLIRADFASATNLSSRIDAMWALESAKSYHKKVMESPAHTTALELQNILSSTFSIENRSPFYDKRVVEYCVSLPSSQKLRNGTTRYILREAMRGIIPEINRIRLDKSNLSIAFCANLSSIDRTRVVASLANLHPYLKNKINVLYLFNNWDVVVSDPYGAGQNTYVHCNIYTVFMLNAWLHKIEPIQ